MGSNELNIKNAEQQKIENRITGLIPGILDSVMQSINIDVAAKLPATDLKQQLKPIIENQLKQSKEIFDTAEFEYIQDKVVSEITGLGPLEVLLNDESIDDILVNGHKKIYIERNGLLENTPYEFYNDSHVLKILNRILSPIGRRIDETVPFVDARLANGDRVNAIIPPLSVSGPTVSIRKFRKRKFNIEDYLESETLTENMAKLLDIAIKSRLNIIICGGTGSGKTTFLNTVSEYLPHTDRIISIEDTIELQLKQPHVVSLETRIANIEGHGRVTQRDLFKNTLRMRPDRIIVGEVRGEEALDMLQAMDTGHDGSLTTIHASSPSEVPMRLVNMVAMTGFDYPPSLTMRQVANTISIIVHVERMSDGKRRVMRISEVLGYENDQVKLQDLFKFDFQESEDHKITGKFVCSNVIPDFKDRVALHGLEKELLEVMNAR